MKFKQFLEASDDLFRLAYSLGEMPRREVERLLSSNRRDLFGSGLADYGDRTAFTTQFGWSVPCKEVVDVIKQYAREPLYDVLAGSGYWAKILRKAGINVIASDIHKITSKNHYHKGVKSPYVRDTRSLIKPEKERIIRRNALKVGYDLNRIRLKGDIFLSWPPYEESFVTDLLEMLPIGTRVFYIGESAGGCTGDASFHNFLDNNFRVLHEESLPKFPAIHDHLWVYEKYKNGSINDKLRNKCFGFWNDDE